jgi:hypothetical protein
MPSRLAVNRHKRDAAEESKLFRISVGNRSRVLNIMKEVDLTVGGF